MNSSLNSTLVEALVGRSLADVERDLILETLKRCVGNRTHAANILRISIRTMRNKLHEYASDGLNVPSSQMVCTPREDVSNRTSPGRDYMAEHQRVIGRSRGGKDEPLSF